MAWTSILIVDDNKHMRQILRAMLRGLGYPKLEDVASAEEGLEFMRETPADIVLCDLHMPGIDGAEFVRMLRTSPDSGDPFVPVIMLTGYPSRTNILKARDSGVDELLAKPITAKALMGRIQAVIHQRRDFVRTKTYFGPCRRRFALTNGTEAPQRRASDHELSFDEAEPVKA